MADANSLQPSADLDETPTPAVNAERAPVAAGRLRRVYERAFALIEGVIGAPPYRLDLGRIAAIVVVPVFCWVFFTTSSGMIDIMRRESDDFIGVVGAIVGTTAILVMLAATSWSLGADLGALIARRQFLGERIVVKTIVTSIVFLFVFSISAFFSFTYYYTNIFKLSSKKLVAELQPMELAADVLLPTSKAIATNYDAETARIDAAPGMRAYLDSLDALLQTANGAAASLHEGLQKSHDEQQRAAAEAARKSAAELQGAQAAARQLAETRSKIAALNQVVVDLEPIIKSKQEEIAALTSVARQEDQLSVDASKGLDGLGAACGSNCESHRGKANAARRRIATIRETLAAPSNERAEAIKQRDALSAQIITLRQKAESAVTRLPPPAPAEDSPPDFAAATRELAVLRDQIRADPSWTKIRRAKASCDTIVAAMRQSNMASPSVAGDFDCEPLGAPAHDLLTARDDILAGRVAFDQKCSLDGAIRDSMNATALRIRNAPEGDKAAASNGFNEAKRIVDDCVVAAKAAGLSEAELQANLKRSDIFLRTHSMDRNRFELAREAFGSLTPDATMAIGVAVAQDAFMFVMKLLSEIFKHEGETRTPQPLGPTLNVADGESDDPDVRVMKALLRLSRPLHGDRSAFDAGVNGVADLPENVKSNLIGLLNRLVREKIAQLDRKGIYILDNRTLAEIETRLTLALKRASRGGAARSDVVAAELAMQDNAAHGFWRRRRSALDRYLSPRFSAPSSEAEEENGDEAAEDASGSEREFG